MSDETWSTVPLSDVLAEPIRNGFSPAESEAWTGVRMLGLGCLSPDGFVPAQLKNAPSSVKATHAAALQDGDLVVSRANTRALVGLAGIYRDVGTPSIYPDLMMRLRPTGEYLTEFLEIVLRWPQTRRSIMAMAQGTSESMVKISGETLRRLPVPQLPLDVQRRIVEVIESVTVLERGIEASIAKLKVMGLSVLQERLASLYAEHDYVALGEAASVARGRFSARPRNDPSFFGGPYPFIQTGDVVAARGGVIHLASQRLNEAGLAVSRMFPAGTVAVTIAANIGDTAILGEQMCFPDSVVGVVPRGEFLPRYLELCLRRAKPTLEAQAPQSAQRNINLQALRPLEIPDAPREVQDELVGVWSSYASQVEHEEAELEKLRRLKQGLVDDLLSGRVKVPMAA